MCLNALEDVYNTCKLNFFVRFLDLVNLTISPDEESRPIAGKILAKWRPHVIEQQQQQQQQQEQEQSQQQEQISLSNRSVPAESTAPLAHDGSAPAQADSIVQPQVSASEA
jgi:symplekin